MKPNPRTHAATLARAPAEGSINVALLPKALRALVRVVGFKAAINLIKQRGGVPLAVPKTINLAEPSATTLALLDALGSTQALAALVEWMGGGTLNYLPKYDSVARQLRHEHVRELSRQGKRLNDIALETGYSRRWVIEVLGLEADDGRQGDLFAGNEGEDWVMEPADIAAPAAASQRGAHNPFGAGWTPSLPPDDDADV